MLWEECVDIMNRLIKPVIFCPIDPLGSSIGGIQTFLKGFIKYAPKDFDIEFIGISSDYKKRPSNKWSKLRLENREFNFFPLFFKKNENKKTLIPLSIRFTLALKFCNLSLSKRILFFHRIEPALVFKKANNHKIGVVHNDIRKQLEKGRSEVLWSKFPWLYFMFEKFIFSFLDIVYTVSKNTLDFYHKKYSEQKEKFFFLPTWIDTEIFYPAINRSKKKLKQDLAKKNKKLSPSNKWIIFVGRLQRQKAPIRLIQTFAQYHLKDRECHLLIFGKGNLEQKIKKKVVKLGLVSFVHFVGYKNQSELAEFYRAADCMLLTSNFEGMPMCVSEALGSGVPVVSTDVGEVNRVIKNGFSGEVVESFCPKDIARSLEKVLKNPNVYRSENCVSCILEYIPEKVLKPVYELMRKLNYDLDKKQV